MLKRKKAQETASGATTGETEEKDKGHETAKRIKIDTHCGYYTKTKTKWYSYVDEGLEIGKPYLCTEDDEEAYHEICILRPYVSGWNREHKRDNDYWHKEMMDAAEELGIKDTICMHRLDKLMKRWWYGKTWEQYPWKENVYIGNARNEKRLAMLMRMFIPVKNDAIRYKDLP